MKNRKNHRKQRWGFSAADASRIGRRVLEAAKAASPFVAPPTLPVKVDAPPAKAKPRHSPPVPTIDNNAATMERHGALYGGHFTMSKHSPMKGRENAGYGPCHKRVRIVGASGTVYEFWTRISRGSKLRGGVS